MVPSKTFPILLVISLVVGCSNGQSPVPVAPGLSFDFYSTSCPGLESIIRNHISQVLQNDIAQAAGLLRLFFHDCFVQGCDGSILLDESTEQDAPPNLTLRPEAFQIINDLQALVQCNCGPVVSCADITTLATRDAINLAGGPFFFTPLGRRDSLDFATVEETLANLPPSFFNTTQLLNAFAAKNMNATDLVALSGGHTIGIAHCPVFTARLYDTPPDPVIDPAFADNLRLICPTRNTDNTTDLDIRTPDLFDNRYFVNLVNLQGLLFSDQNLFTDSRTRDIVTSFANNQTLFFEKFIIGMLKMGQLNVLTGTQGEIRANCSVTNANNVELLTAVKLDLEQGRVSQY